MILIWLGLIIVLMLLEVTCKNFVTIWFAISASISLILSIFIDSYIIGFSVFVILGTILLVTIRDKSIKYIKNKRGKSEK